MDWDGISPLIDFSEGALSKEQARRYWLESPWVKKFETGLCSEDDFASGVVDELKLVISPEEFLEQFITWNRGLFPGTSELLERLRNRFILACLSNNNELHWKSLTEKTDLVEWLDHIFLSFEMGVMKPAKEAFQYVIDKIGYPPQKIVFFDDSYEYIDAANDLGFQAYQVLGLKSVYSTLNALEITV